MHNATDHGVIPEFRTLLARRLPARKVAAAFHRLHPTARRGRKLARSNFVHALVFHPLRQLGTLAQHVNELFGQDISESAMAQRRARLPWELFARLLELALRPLAEATVHPHAFYQGWRLVGIDGTQFSLSNTPRVLGSLSKAAARRMRAAFAKLGVGVFVELGTHSPLAAEIGRAGECEQVLAVRLLDRLPAGCLLLGDRLYGVGKWMGRLLRVCGQKGSHCLLRASTRLKAQVLEVYADGSALVQVQYRDDQNKTVRLQVREIRGVVVRHDGQRRELRLWTDLLDAARYPAMELLQLYGQRWEQELSYKELKVDLRGGELLASHSVETAAQEVACLLIAQSLVAEWRLAVGGAAVLRVSFAKVRVQLEGLWMALRVSPGILSAEQEARLVESNLVFLRRTLNPGRRARSCPRAVRQPVGSWPRLTRNHSHKAPLKYELTPITTLS